MANYVKETYAICILFDNGKQLLDELIRAMSTDEAKENFDHIRKQVMI